jgi:acetylornithine deacetylase/succinyl-diaminopimelate desuccinylase
MNSEVAGVFDRDEFHRRAIQTPSHDGVAAMRELLVTTLTDEGYEPVIDEQGNVRVSRGSADSGGTHLVLNTHLDTVPPHVAYERDGDTVRGRGACDAKGPLAAMLDAFCAAELDDGRLTLAVTPNEETSQRGGAYLGETLAADGYIVGEPTGLDVCTGARGNFGGHVTIYGESAHAGDPSQGTNPPRAVGPLIEALEQYDEAHGPSEHELLGSPTLVPTHIEGGGPLNQTPADCTVSFDRRTVPPETIDEFVASLQEYLEQRLPSTYRFKIKPAYPDSPNPEAFATNGNSTLVETLTEVSGGAIRPFGAATEASYFAAHGPVVVFGPGVLADEAGPVAHASREYVSRAAVRDAAAILQTTVERLC